MTVDLGPYASVVPDVVVERMRRAKHVLAVSHENPDGDTVGSTLAVSRMAEALGAKATPLCTDPVPALYDFLDGVGRFRTDPDPDEHYDLLVVSDCGSLDRIGAVRERHPRLFAELPRVVIDHHASNDAMTDGDWIDPAAAATCEMSTLLAVRLGLPLDLAGGTLATDLIAGIVMDTATFAHPNTTPRTLAVSAALVEAGAPLSDVSRRLYRTKPIAQLRLFGVVLGRLESDLGGRLVWSTLRDADLAATDTSPEHSEGIIDLLAQGEATEIALLIKEDGPDTRLSVRTRAGGVDATVLTRTFGGGGHARAAGATIRQPLDRAVPVVLDEARRLLETAGPTGRA